MIAVLADTHMPRGTRRLPERCVELIAAADAVIHAGDFFALSALEEIRELCPAIHAVHGNVDEEPLRRLLPAEAAVEVGRRTVAITHDAGPAKGRLARLARRFPTADAVVFGHSHLPLHEEEGGFQIFNPGSPTERRRAPRPSMGPARLPAKHARVRARLALTFGHLAEPGNCGPCAGTTDLRTRGRDSVPRLRSIGPCRPCERSAAGNRG